jgi:hypothetical protein
LMHFCFRVVLVAVFADIMLPFLFVAFSQQATPRSEPAAPTPINFSAFVESAPPSQPYVHEFVRDRDRFYSPTTMHSFKRLTPGSEGWGTLVTLLKASRLMS